MWDKESGNELQPWSSIKNWADLTENEKRAATVLGYTDTSWDNASGEEPQPVSYFKYWDELTACGDGEDTFIVISSRSFPLSVLSVAFVHEPRTP